MFQSAWALWGLLAVPALVAIHYFRRRARQIEVSTFFLLKERERVTQRGAVWTRFENSWPFFLQLLAVILAVLFCAQPVVLKEEAKLRIAFVVDDTVSMRAVTTQVYERVGDFLSKVPSGMMLDIGLFTSSPGGEHLGYFSSERGVVGALKSDLSPRAGLHDPSAKIEAAQRWAGAEGLVVWVSDLAVEGGGADIDILVGEVLDNVGITGIQFFDDGRWEARITNFSDKPAMREWWLVHDGGATAVQQFSVAAGQSLRVSGRSVDGLVNPYLKLSDDALDIDNVAPLLAPVTDPLKIAVSLDEANADVWRELAPGFEGWTRAVIPENAHVIIRDQALEGPMPGIQFVRTDSSLLSEDWSRGPYLREEHPLANGLTLGGFLARFGTWDAPTDAEVLFRQSTRPIVWLPRNSRSTLVFEFAPSASNVSQHPGVLLLIDRFLREQQVAMGLVRVENYFFGEAIALPRLATGVILRKWIPGIPEPVDLEVSAAQQLRAPRQVCAFEVIDPSGDVIHRGTSHFWEATELDLRSGNSNMSDVPNWTERFEARFSPIPGINLIPGIILALLLGSWWMVHRGERPKEAVSA